MLYNNQCDVWAVSNDTNMHTLIKIHFGQIDFVCIMWYFEDTLKCVSTYKPFLNSDMG